MKQHLVVFNVGIFQVLKSMKNIKNIFLKSIQSENEQKHENLNDEKSQWRKREVQAAGS